MTCLLGRQMLPEGKHNIQVRTDTGMASNDRTENFESAHLRAFHPIVDIDVLLPYEYHPIGFVERKQCVPETPLAYANNTRGLADWKCLCIAPPFLHKVQPVCFAIAVQGRWMRVSRLSEMVRATITITAYASSLGP